MSRAVRGGLSERRSQVVACFEVGNGGADSRPVGCIAGRAEAHRLEGLLDLAHRERIAVRDLLTQRLRAGALAGQTLS